MKKGVSKAAAHIQEPPDKLTKSSPLRFCVLILGSFCEVIAGESPAPDLVDGRGMGRDEDIFVLSLFS